MKTAYIINLPASYSEFAHITAPIMMQPRGTLFKGYNQALIKISRFIEKEFMEDDFKLNHDHIIFTDKKKAAVFSRWLEELNVKEPRKAGSLFYGVDDFTADHGTINFMFNFIGEDLHISEDVYQGRGELSEFIWKTLDDASVKRYWMISPQLIAFEDRNDGLLARTILEKAIPEFRQEQAQRKAHMRAVNAHTITASAINYNSSGYIVNNGLAKSDAGTYNPEVTVPMSQVRKLVNQKLKKILRKKKKP